MDFNLNEYVKVQLTDHGRAIHKKWFEDVWTDTKFSLAPAIKYSPPTEDENGWSKWQLWHLMEIFGKHIGMGKPNVFRLTIKICSNS